MANKFWQGVNNILKSTVPVYDKVEQAVDEHIRDTVTPIRGSVVYCNFDIVLRSVAEHTGIVTVHPHP